MFHLKCTEPVLSKDDYVKAKRTWTCRVCVRGGRAGLSLAIDTTDKGKDTVFVSQVTSVVDIMNELRAFRQEIKEANCDFRRQLETYSEWIVDNGKKIEEGHHIFPLGGLTSGWFIPSTLTYTWYSKNRFVT
ncbi:hypothetical protein J6590_077873 [Homalodisca vitripennis]|nr:hypothetical protein J6590_077873 [Homalodisca vitripennis]